ncbi:potassium channel family protein [Meiothermus hypogaeus]|uniref:Trk system potassium uptake protein TrkA n=2 Tax=Meiothermus hypogaeus TaxID=884155 RepID=A0A511QXB7_9DEIN|nr:TrkA family potassium uptake protein [Meiothermus hypogaeus]RIH77502.1 Trk system potassium uptake protein TrkA [Meiothermus hypogaeus]GEM82028.1 potassium transporter TrkA [Meiothermus hypogaeus NBRC 106114]GIW35966.1 MAG: potassium transporter TrkA [Meiothermus sp.]
MNVIIVGGGKVGADLAGLLCAGGHRVRVIELRPERIPLLQSELPPEVVVQGSGTDPALLQSVDIRQAQVVAAVTGSDETNLVVTNLARLEFAVPRTIARINNPKNAWMFTPEMGVDVALNQSDLMAHLIAEEMSLGDMMTLLKLRRGQFSLVEEKIDPKAPAAGKALRDLTLPTECNLVAVLRRGELLLPKPELVLRPGDEVLAVVHSDHAAALAALLGAG